MFDVKFNDRLIYSLFNVGQILLTVQIRFKRRE